MKSYIYATILLSTTLLLTSVAWAQQPSFSCLQASTHREKVVCSSPALSKADLELSDAYASLRRQLLPEAAAAVQADERQWLHYLDVVCTASNRESKSDADCLDSEYKQRIAELKPTRLSNDELLYSRRVSLTTPLHTPDPDSLGSDPGYGRGSFSYPQIDSTAASATAFNQASEALARSLGYNEKGNPAQSFQAATQPDSEVDVTWKELGNNQHFLAVALTSEYYSYGGAHPLTTVRNLNWLLDAGRELQEHDVFASDWAPHVMPLVLARIKKNTDWTPGLWNGKELSQGISTGTARVRSWTLTDRSITFAFDQYEVAAFAFGMPKATISWQQLAPVLAPGFNPEIFPAAKPVTH